MFDDGISRSKVISEYVLELGLLHSAYDESVPLIKSSLSLFTLVRVRINRRISPIRNLQLAMIIILILLTLPQLLNSRKRSTPISTRVAIRNRLRCPPFIRIENTRVRAVEVAMCEVGSRPPFADPVAGELAHVREDVGADVPAS